MKLAPLPPQEIQKREISSLIQQLSEDEVIRKNFPKEIKELNGFKDGKITTIRAIQIVQTIQKQ